MADRILKVADIPVIGSSVFEGQAVGLDADGNRTEEIGSMTSVAFMSDVDDPGLSFWEQARLFFRTSGVARILKRWRDKDEIGVKEVELLEKELKALSSNELVSVAAAYPNTLSAANQIAAKLGDHPTLKAFCADPQGFAESQERSLVQAVVSGVKSLTLSFLIPAAVVTLLIIFFRIDNPLTRRFLKAVGPALVRAEQKEGPLAAIFKLLFKVFNLVFSKQALLGAGWKLQALPDKRGSVRPF